GRSSIVGGDHTIIWIAHAVKGGAIEVIRRRKLEDQSWSNGVYPREVAKDVLLALTITDSRSLVIGSVGNLVEVRASRANKSQLIVRRAIKYQRCEDPAAGAQIMNHRAVGSRQSMIGAVPIHTHVIRGAIIMIAEAELVVCRIEASVTHHQFALARALKAGAGRDVEHAKRAVAILRRQAASLLLYIVHIFGIELR